MLSIWLKQNLFQIAWKRIVHILNINIYINVLNTVYALKILILNSRSTYVNGYEENLFLLLKIDFSLLSFI